MIDYCPVLTFSVYNQCMSNFPTKLKPQFSSHKAENMIHVKKVTDADVKEAIKIIEENKKLVAKYEKTVSYQNF